MKKFLGRVGSIMPRHLCWRSITYNLQGLQFTKIFCAITLLLIVSYLNHIQQPIDLLYVYDK
jgi:hypothetical protein